ncbi:response regulator [Algihabitans albus]|uniref:response regulator n=1 Tax=Algihabitans albus TaxID=2164067 RepID=UPI001ABC01BA|nr:response regulator [Algihabitans albus]
MTAPDLHQAASRPTVMLVEDDETDQLIYKRVIARSGLLGEVVSFYYADEALEFLKREDRQKIDVIFLDINLPRMSGFEFLEAATIELGEKFAKAVIVMLTTSLNPKDRARAGEFKVVKTFINKPLTAENVHDVVALLERDKDGSPV